MGSLRSPYRDSAEQTWCGFLLPGCQHSVLQVHEPRVLVVALSLCALLLFFPLCLLAVLTWSRAGLDWESDTGEWAEQLQWVRDGNVLEGKSEYSGKFPQQAVKSCQGMLASCRWLSRWPAVARQRQKRHICHAGGRRQPGEPSLQLLRSSRAGQLGV